MGSCQYRFNPSEQYQLQHPGAGIETSCGRKTYPAVDEPELFPVHDINGVTVMRETGRFLPRAQDDPYCPYHGGTEEPPPPPVSQAELLVAHQRYLELAQRYEGQAAGAITAAVPEPTSYVGPNAFEKFMAENPDAYARFLEQQKGDEPQEGEPQ